MKRRFLTLLLTVTMATSLLGCTKGAITSTSDIEEVSGNSVVNVDPGAGIKCDKDINEVAYNIVTTAYNNAASKKQGTAEISYMDENYAVTSQASIMQDQETDATMFYYTEQTEEMFQGYLYRYIYKGADVETTVWTTTEFGWVESTSLPPYNVDALELFAYEDYTYSKVFEEPVTFLGEDENAEETGYYTLLSAGVSDVEGYEDIIRYASVYIHKESMLPVASIVEYVDISQDAALNIETNELIEHVLKTEVVLYTFSDDDISGEVTMNPEYDEIIDEQTYLQKMAQKANESATETTQEDSNE